MFPFVELCMEAGKLPANYSRRSQTEWCSSFLGFFSTNNNKTIFVLLFPPRLPDALDRDDRPLYFQTADMAECLAAPGYNAERLSVPYVPQVTGESDRRSPSSRLSFAVV